MLPDGSPRCPRHRARFDVGTGEMLSGPKGRLYGFRPYPEAVKAHASLPPFRLKR